MADTKVTVESSTTEQPAPVVHAPTGRFHFLKTLVAVYLSRKFLVTLTFGWIIYGIYWAAVKCLYTFENPEQLRAFTVLFQTTMGILGGIALGYLGFSRTSQGMSSYIPQIGGFGGGGEFRRSQPFHQPGASTKNEDL